MSADFSQVTILRATVKGFALLFCLAFPATAAAQTTNADILRKLAADCIGPIATPYATLVVNPDPLNPFLTHAVVSRLRQDEKDIFLDPGAAPEDTARQTAEAVALTYFVDDAAVGYEARGRRRIERTLELQLSYLMTDVNARVLTDSTCTLKYEDLIARSDLDAVESESIPLTKGEHPRRGWLRRYAEPIVVAGATAVAVYLFFNVRSDANDSQ